MRFVLSTCCCLFLLVSCKQDAVWEDLSPPAKSPVYDLYFIAADTGFAAGGIDYFSEKKSYTQDGGLTWDSLPSLYGQAVLGIDFSPKKNIGYTSGIAGRILRTRDRGNRWDLTQTFLFHDLHAVAAISDTVALVAGGGSRGEGEIWKTKDSGDNWDVSTFDFELRDIYFPNSTRGFACGYAAVIRTEDAGQSWEELDVEGDLFSAIHFPHPDTGYVVGFSGEIARTYDGGDSWTTLRSASAFVQDRHHYHDILFRSGTEGYVVGKNGLILFTQNAGRSWKKLEAPQKDDFYTASFNPDGSLWIAGEAGEVFRLEE